MHNSKFYSYAVWFVCSSIWLPCSAQPFFAGVINSQGDVQFTVDQFKDQVVFRCFTE